MKLLVNFERESVPTAGRTRQGSIPPSALHQEEGQAGGISDRSERPVLWGSGRHPGRPRGPHCGARLAVHRREGCATCPNAVAALNASSALLGAGHFLVGRAAPGAPRGPPRSFKDGRPLAKAVVERGDVTTANDAVDADDTHGMPAISVRRPAFRQTRSHG